VIQPVFYTLAWPQQLGHKREGYDQGKREGYDPGKRGGYNEGMPEGGSQTD